MKDFFKIFTAVFALSAVLYSCTPSIPLAQQESDNNPTYRVYYLFEHEGCKVYRFRDYGNYVYFTNCTGDSTSMVNDSTRVHSINRGEIIPNRDNE